MHSFQSDSKKLYRISGTDKNGYFLCLRETAVALHLLMIDNDPLREKVIYHK